MTDLTLSGRVARVTERCIGCLPEDKTTKADSEDENVSPDKPNITPPGKVEKIIPPIGNEPEKAQITLEGADDLYREVRIENALQDGDGKQVSLSCLTVYAIAFSRLRSR